MKKLLILHILVTLLTPLFLWLIGGFIANNYNTTEWDSGGRFVLCLLSLGGIIIVNSIVNSFKEY